MIITNYQKAYDLLLKTFRNDIYTNQLNFLGMIYSISSMARDQLTYNQLVDTRFELKQALRDNGRYGNDTVKFLRCTIDLIFFERVYHTFQNAPDNKLLDRVGNRLYKVYLRSLQEINLAQMSETGKWQIQGAARSTPNKLCREILDYFRDATAERLEVFYDLGKLLRDN